MQPLNWTRFTAPFTSTQLSSGPIAVYGLIPESTMDTIVRFEFEQNAGIGHTLATGVPQSGVWYGGAVMPAFDGFTPAPNLWLTTLGGTASFTLAWLPLHGSSSRRPMFRLAANTNEQLIHAGSCLVHGIFCQTAPSGSTLTLRDAKATGGSNVKYISAVGLPAAGVQFAGFRMDNGLTAQSSTTNRWSVLYEPL